MISFKKSSECLPRTCIKTLINHGRSSGFPDFWRPSRPEHSGQWQRFCLEFITGLQLRGQLRNIFTSTGFPFMEGI